MVLDTGYRVTNNGYRDTVTRHAGVTNPSALGTRLQILSVLVHLLKRHTDSAE